jgi:aspartate aminotransferase
MPNAGLSETRKAVAEHLRRETGELYAEQHIVMTTGAGGALVVLLKSILDPGDEVIVLAPFFVEYVHYVANFGGKTVVVQTDDAFAPDPDAIAAAITPRTRAIITNAPNNPTGVVYDAAALGAVAQVLEAASETHGRPIYWISDEPYRALAYDGVEVPWPIHHYAHLLHVTSFSKDLALPGERIGYIALPPPAGGMDELFAGIVFSMRALGFVNAPALQQRLVAGLLDEPVDVKTYARHRHRILEALEGAGYDVVRPGGAFYVFPRVPGSEDDIAFVRRCLEERLLVVPGSGFGRPGYFRLSYAVTERTVDLAVDALTRVAATTPSA